MGIQKFKKTTQKILYLCVLFVLTAPVTVFGQNLNQAPSNLESLKNKLGGNVQGDLPTLVGNIIKSILSLVGIIFFVLTVYAGFLWMTARGDDSKIEKAKEILKSSITGLFIVVSAYAITVFVTKQFG